MERIPTYDSASAKSAVSESLAELLRFRDLLVMLINLSVTVRYKRSLLGIGWTLLNPLLNMAVLTIAFSALFGDALPRYPVYVLVGLLMYDFFGQTTTFAMNQLTWGSALLARSYVPATVFPLSAVGTSLVNFVLALVPLSALMILTGSPFSWPLASLPLTLLLLACLSLGMGLILSVLALSFTDVVSIWSVLLHIWYFLTPIIYPEHIFPTGMRWLLKANPLYHLLICLREPIYLGKFPDPHHFLVAASWSLGVLVVGWWYFSHRRFEFALQAG